MARRGRGLTPEERALWRRVAATTDRGADEPPVPPTGASPEPPPDETPKSGALRRAARSLPRTLRPEPRLAGSTARVVLSGPEVGPVGRPEAGLDRRTAERMRRGAREPDMRIDLHGMRAERAHRACLTFLADALARGARMVLVITGKGAREQDDDWTAPRRGVLRESLPGWLRASPLGPSIVGIYQAHRRHGGEGAFYVYLKRRR